MQNELKTVVGYAFKSVHREDGWIHPLCDVVDVTEEQANWRPAPEVASIAEVVAHLEPYMSDVVQVLRGEEKVDHEDWGGTQGQSWSALKARLLNTTAELEAEIGKLSEEDLATPAPGKATPRWEILMDIAIHNAYHAGQIVKLTQEAPALAASK